MNEADILVVGGGSAGSVLAARLSAESECHVVLVEAGRDLPPGGVPADIANSFPRAYANPAYFWPGLQAAARAGAYRRPFTQARLLGGGSSVMGMWALRGLPSDYDGWAMGGAPGWAWDDVLPFFRKIEADRDMATSEHGRDGPVSIGRVPPDHWPGFTKALAAAGGRHQLRLLPDLNSTNVDGVFAIPASVTEFRPSLLGQCLSHARSASAAESDHPCRNGSHKNRFRGPDGGRRSGPPRRRLDGDDPRSRDDRLRRRHSLSGSLDEVGRWPGQPAH